ncbi:MAG TPA: aminoacyl-tRNA hydrolase [Pyrinomonadaceae bacterium]|nr:aminoacyl-tRNA hydrolase [Acidobacteriota bacterium]HQZ98334.1 aminoacyl-tRNA hydrolase [Pyrinomonadaceae bacterium]
MSNWLIVGLGNPGPEYAKTRHNLGFMLVDRLASRLQTRVARNECRALVGRAEIDNQVVELVKPQTYMNLSGEAVSGLLAKGGRSIERLVVISDDLALPFGTMRIRSKGSHGGQNGLRSIIDCLKTQDFIRLRIGIQPEHPIRDAAKFVLENFAKGDAETLEKILDESADAVQTIVKEGVDAAMGRFNGVNRE